MANQIKRHGASSEVRIPIQARMFLLKSEIEISQGTNNKFAFTYQFDLKTSK